MIALGASTHRPHLTSTHAIGSLAHGGYAPAVSDVDLALLTDDSVTQRMPDVVDWIVDEIRQTRTALADRFSIFHAQRTQCTEPPAASRFPPINRYTPIRSGVLISGSERGLHREVLSRLGDQRGLPRRDELMELTGRLADSVKDRHRCC